MCPCRDAFLRVARDLRARAGFITRAWTVRPRSEIAGHRGVFGCAMAAALALLALPRPAAAGVIALQPAVLVSLTNDTAVVAVEITNTGDEPAHNLAVELALEDQTAAGGPARPLGANATAYEFLCLDALPPVPGRYHAILTIRYTDARGYPFSAVACLPVDTAGLGDEAPVTASLSSAVIGDRGRVRLRLRASAARAVDVRVRLLLPDELACDRPMRNVVIFPGRPAALDFGLRNRHARRLSDYPAFALADFDLDGVHRSVLAEARVSLAAFPALPFGGTTLWLALAAALALGFVLRQLRPVRPPRVPAAGFPGWVLRHREGCLAAVVLAALLGFTLVHIPPSLLLLDTLTVGGDTPAHNYLASHLKEQLFGHGRVVSWAGGWWCGFPMFQFYFPLPYLLIALLSVAIPFNVAFKLVSVAGILGLPAAAYGAGRLLRLPRPVPVLLAIAMLPFLFVRTHTMWGVNIPSTLAGMIANSLSFPIMLLAIAGAWRDAEDGHFRLRTVWLFVALLASHFFTSVMAALAVAAIPLLRAPRGFRRAVSVLAREGGLAVLLMAWWLVPLAAKSDYSMEFGTNWAVTLRNTLPPYVPALLPLVLLAPVLALLRGARAVWLFVWMFGAAAFLFVAGFALAPVFVNVRLWPFLFFGLLALAAAGLGLLAHGRRAPELLALAALVAGLAGVQAGERSAAPQAAAPIAPCARWNYEGMERKPYASVVRDLVLPLRETPGRLANDLHDDNGALGSSRFFEAVPHLTGKPVLEGGLVNSAAGALFSYYVQGETSRASAGYPTLVKPATFNLAHATAHLRLFNVKHFIARWPPLREALARAPEWRRLRSAAGWDLYELTTHDGRYVRVPARLPVAVETRRWKEYALEWLYTFEALDQPFVFIKPGEGAAVPSPVPPLSEAQFRRVLAHWRPSRGDVCEWLYLGPFPCPPHAADPLAFRPVDEDRLEPVEGERAFGRTWRLLFGRGSITPDPCARGREHGVGYGGVNVFAPSAREARLEFAQDDAVAIWLNGERVAGGGRTGPGRFESVAVRLTRGRNRLRLKHYQATGGAFFHVRITDPDGAPFPDLVCSVENEPPVVPELPGPEPRLFGPSVSAEQVADDRIRFRTDAPRAPHLIACTYYPNWKVRGAARVFMVTPAFMLVYPEGEDVELYYGATVADTAGRLLALAGAVLAAALVLRRPGPRRVLGRCVSRVAWLKFLDATAGFCLCWAAGYLRFWLIRRAPPPTACVGDHVRRLLVVRPGGLGDMVLLIPVLRRLEAGFPGAALDIVCERRNLDVLRLAGLDSRALLYDAHPLRLLARLLTHRYDAAVDTEQFHYFSALIAALSRAPVRIGFKINPGRNLLYTHLVTYALDGYEGDQFLRLLAPLGAAGAPCAVEGCLRDAATAALSDADAAALDRTAAAGPLVALGAGSSLPLKQWPVSRFAGLARRLADEDGAGVVLLGGAGDRRVCRAVLGELRAGGDPDSRPVHPAGAAIPARATTARREPDTADGGRIVSFAGRLSLSQTATVLRRCRVFVSGDSGLAHLALALGTPAVVLFGPSDPLKWGHATGLGRVVRHPVACAPCCIFGYHKLCRTAHCMGGIAVEPVRAACREFL